MTIRLVPRARLLLGPVLFLLQLRFLSYLMMHEKRSAYPLRRLTQKPGCRSLWWSSTASFQSRLTIAYQTECNGSLPQNDIALIAKAILYTYNGMVEKEYCDR